LPDTVSLQTWGYGWSWSSESFTRIRKYIAETARERLFDDDSEIQIKCRGIDGNSAAGACAIASRSQQFSWWWAAPLPRISLAVRMRRYADLAIGSVVDISALDLPIFTDSSVYGLIVSRGIDLQGAKLDLEMYLIPAIETCLWAPSATVDSYDAGSLTITCEHDYYTDDVAGDAGRFSAPGDDMILMLLDSHGAPLCDNTPMVVSIAGDDIEIDASFSLGGVDVDPAAGNILTFCRVDNAAAPEADWGVTMRYCAVQADSSNTPPDLPDLGHPAVVYGG
jgi:hypothetical protein